jgi:gluconate 2-dehydrogenase gamma chain
MSGKRSTIQRRTFLGAVLAGAAGGTAIALGKRGGSAWRFFTDEEAWTVAAICEQLIPADRDPGARQADVVNYIDIQLTKHFRKHQKVYRSGIEKVEGICRSRFGKAFADLSPQQQQDVLNHVEKHVQPFFDLILAHTRQGFYGDPRHGGNRDMVSWKMLGLPFPPVRGRMHYGDGPKVG